MTDRGGCRSRTRARIDGLPNNDARRRLRHASFVLLRLDSCPDWHGPPWSSMIPLDLLTQSILARLFLALLSWLVHTTWNVAFFGPVGGAAAQVELAGHGLSVSELADDL